MNTIKGIRAMLDTLEAHVQGTKASVPMAPVAEKPKRQASDALKAWNAYVDKVKADMLASGWTHPETGKPVTRKDAMQEAKARRDTDPEGYKPQPKPQPAAKPTATAAVAGPSHPAAAAAGAGEPTDSDAKPKRKPMTEEHKAKLAAGRKAAAERKKAEKAAAAAEASPSPPPVKVTSFAPLPESDNEDDSALLPINIKGKKLVYNPSTNGCYKRLDDGSKGAWVGLLDPLKKEIDASVKETDLDGVYDDEE